MKGKGKMGKIKVESYSATYCPPKGYVAFALCSSPKDGRKQCFDFETCKAFLQDHVRRHVEGEDARQIDMGKLRLLVVGEGENDPQFKERLYCAKKVVNFYEEVAGWRRSKITKVEHSACDKVWLITGPRQWIHSPQLLSMVTFILRMFTNKGPVKFETNEDLENIYKDWLKEGTGTSDMTYLSHCWDKLFLIMKHYDELFGGFTPEDLHTNNRETGVGSHSNGIVYLCQFNSSTEELNTRMQKLDHEKNRKSGEE